MLSKTSCQKQVPILSGKSPTSRGQKKFLVVFLVACGFQLSAFSICLAAVRDTGSLDEHTGNAGANFLKLNPGVRSAGMADAFVAVADDSSASYLNPAGLAFLPQIELFATYSRQFGLLEHNGASFVWPIEHKVSLAFGGLFGGLTKDYKITDLHGDPTEENLRYKNNLFSLAIAPKITDWLAVGIGFKYLTYELSEQSKRKGLAFDLGILLGKTFKFGVALRNLGPDIKSEEQSETDHLPTTLGLGFAYRPRNLVLAGELDVVDMIAGRARPCIHLGGEYWIGGVVAPRVGLKGAPGSGPGPRFTAGLGIKIKNFQFDYAFVAHQDLGPTHRVGSSLRFGKPPVAEIEIEEEEKAIELLAEEERKFAEEAARKKTEEETKLGEEARRKAEWERQKKEARLRAEREKAQIEIKPPAKKFNVALLDLGAKNVSQMDAMVIRDFIQVAMVNTGAVTVVERANMDKVLAEQGFQMTGCTDRECAVEIGKILNVQKVVIGSFSKLLETYYITASIVDIASGEVEVAETAQAPSPAELKTTAEGLARKLIGKLLQKHPE